MSTTRLLILGVVRIFQPVHGYDVRRELLSWHADDWAHVAPGSVYHALKKLAEEGLLTEVATQRVGARPARTTYEITDKGEAEFQDLLRRYWWEYTIPADPFTPAWAFLPALSRDEAAGALRNRARLLRLFIDGTRVRLAAAPSPDAPHVAELFELSMAKARVEAEWCERLAGRVEAGELPSAD
ncbi:PadR family transcriptional regulator [Rugosimonospora acidiphila]|uniref:PadR family transcriptional regulator n=1 Tax=Rugosimonospora acidiphila TaxID=556531 RepID=A0ABP9RPS7_9ACTN